MCEKVEDKTILDRIQAIRRWLERYRADDQELDLQSERLGRIETKMYSVGSPVLTDMPRAPSLEPDKLSRLVHIKTELSRDVEDLLNRHRAERANIEALIRRLWIPGERAVIRLYYLDREDWTKQSEEA